MKKALMMAAVAAFALSAPVMANESNKDTTLQIKVDKKFSETDTNGDGMISKNEHEEKGGEKFSDADTNSDGSLSKAEVTAHMRKEWSEKKETKTQ